jgi:hypothetical protein
MGRFLALDPIAGDDNNPLTQNGYSYVENNPVSKVDPDGKWAQRLPGFRWGNTKTGPGFRVNINRKFLSKYYCLAFAYNIMRVSKIAKWSWRYGYRFNSLTISDIAAEAYAHAVLYYTSRITIKLFKRGYGWRLSGKVIDVARNDPRRWRFRAIWALF